MRIIVSFILSFLILLSSSGIAYAEHFCGGLHMLSKVTFGEEQLSCGMATVHDDCDHEMEENHFCCSNKYLKVSTDDQYAKVSFEFNFYVAVFNVPMEVPSEVLNVLPENDHDSYRYYRPPPLERDLQILYDTFLI